MSIFIDTSVWFAAAVARDHDNASAKSILASTTDHVTSDHIVVETWALLNTRYRREIAERFWAQLRRGGIRIEMVTAADLEAAWAISTAFADQDFSIVDCTSFAVMERLGISQAASFDNHFAVYRYGRARDKAFDIVRSGHSDTFRLFHQAILERQQISCRYSGLRRDICPHILGHTAGEEKALVYQFGGESTSKPLGKGEWRCLQLAKVSDVIVRDGPWHTGTGHRKTQRCVQTVYIDVNTRVPNQPGRR